MANSLTIPPYRAALLTNADGSPFIRANGPESEPVLTERQWYMFWQNMAGQVTANTQALEGFDGFVSYGNHADRPDPGPWPDGALYIEQDRGGVLYQNQGGTWQYIAGIMYGTISPDQRPDDLGPAADAGFQFSTNVDPARSFIWNGGQWVETTPTRYGTHAERLAVTLAEIVSGMLWAETDRGDVLYQNQGGTWQYLTGTMYGTLSPDQRPSDLTAAQDAGFQFRTNTDPARAFAWSSTAWIETTPIRYGTHAERLATPVGGIVSGMLWMETDRGSVIYQNQGGIWLFLSGTMWGTLVPDQRPTDLGVHDAGFDFRSTVAPPREFIWNQTAWVETTPPRISTQTQPSRALGTIYQNTNATPLFAAVTIRLQSAAGASQINTYTDASPSPGTLVAAVATFVTGPPDVLVQLFFIVLPNNYYRVAVAAGTGGGVSLWTEWF